MSLSPRQSSPPKRPRLSLLIKTPTPVSTLGRSSTALKADIDPTSPTAFNTLSNAYAVAIENASPRTTVGFGSLTPKATKPTPLRLETKLGSEGGYLLPSQHTQTPGPFTITYPDTPSSAFPDEDSTPTLTRPQLVVSTASSNFTPPQSAGSTDPVQTRVFTFTANTARKGSLSLPRTPRRRATLSQFQPAPYTHPRALHSILRNSPLPPRSSMTPGTPTRSSLRLANRSNKKVEYNDPLTQTITTNKYVKSHIDLLSEDSPQSDSEPQSATSDALDLAMEYTGDETRDGGSTPGPFEEMRRRMADSGLETPAKRKRKRKDKKHKWEWTITNADAEMGQEQDVEMMMNAEKTPLTAIKVEKTPNTAIFMRDMSVDSEMSEADEPRRSSLGSVTDSESGAEDVERPGSSQSL